MPQRTRTQNVHAAQWSPNGGSLGQADLTQPGANVFGENVFSTAVQRQRLPKAVYKQLQETLEAGELLEPALADAVATAMKEWAMERGATHFTHWFQPLTGMTAEKHDSFYAPTERRQRDRRVLGQGADPGRARRLVVPDRRHPGHLRGARLHRVGPDVAGLHAREPERRGALHPDRVRLVDGRGARPQDPAAALDGRAVEHGAARAAAVRRRRVDARVHDRRARAGVLPDRRALLLRAPRPDHHRPHAVRRQAAEGPRARRPLLRVDPRARAGLHARDRAAARAARRADQDAPQRGRARPSTRWRRCSRTRTWAPTTSS